MPETLYKSIKLKETGIYFDFHRCNYAQEMPFFEENCLEVSPQSNDTLNEENITDLEDFKIFAQSGLHFIHLNINEIVFFQRLTNYD